MDNLDYASIAGLVVGFGLFSVAIVIRTNYNPGMFVDPAAAIITFGGTISAMMVQFPFTQLIQIPFVLKKFLFENQESPVDLIDELANFADIARRDGILALERVTEDIEDEFLIRGIQLAVDGNDPEVIQYMLSTERDRIMERHSNGQKIFSAAADVLPSMGMAGTVMGLIVMLSQMDNPSAIGEGMALALMTTFYGAVTSYLFAKPVAEKLKLRSKEEILMKNIIIEGIMSIQSGDNPRVVRQKLTLFLSPDDREDTEQ